jgi:hypothetical protein
MQPLFTTNPADIPELEGLYIMESSPQASVQGVNLNGTRMAFESVRGPVGRAVVITSPSRFLDVYGGRDYGQGGAIIGRGWLSLTNRKFGTLLCARACAADAVAASSTLEDAAGGSGAAVLRLDATSPGLWGNNVSWMVQAATDGDADHFNLLVKYLGKVITYQNLDISTGVDNPLAIVGDDDANWVVLTKLADGRPATSTPSVDGADADGWTKLGQTIPGFVSVAGSNGTISDTDFTAEGGPLEQLAAQRGYGCTFVAERSSAALKAKILILAAADTESVWLIGADTAVKTVANAVTDVADYRNPVGRVIYCFNHPYTLDSATATKIQRRPEGTLASILSQTDVNVHPGSEATKVFTQDISQITYAALQRGDYITLRKAGICALENDGGYAFVSGVTTSLVPGYEQITRRREADYILNSLAAAIKYEVKKASTVPRRKAIKGEISRFLGADAATQPEPHCVEKFSVDEEILNTPESLAAGQFWVQVKVRLISFMLEIVLAVEIGTGTVIAQS